MPVAQPPPTDHGYIAMTEMSALRELNERLQLKLATLESKKADALAAQAEAEGRAIRYVATL